MRARAACLLALVACHDADPPAAPMAASPPPIAVTPPPASAPAGEKTTESCAAAVAGKPEFAKCKWSISQSRQRGSCVCNGCFADADCTERKNGWCIPLEAAKVTTPAAKVCLYPTDDCYLGTGCPKGRACNHDGMGNAGRCSEHGDFRPR